MKKYNYKKIIFIAIFVLLLTGCSDQQYTYDEASAPKSMDNFSDAGIIGRIEDLKNGLKPNVKPDSVPASEPGQMAGQAEAQANQKQLENLAAQFDQAIIKTNYGDITVKFYAQESPITVNNFLNLAKANFYNGVKFHRVIKNFMIQGGDPNSKNENDVASWGRGGPGYQFQDEINQHKLVKGSLAMANSGPDTNGSQFFIVTAEATPWLDGKHTNFGYVAKGLAVVEKIEKVEANESDRPLESVIINSVELVKAGAGEEQKVFGPGLPPEATLTPEDGGASATPEAAAGGT
jgi:cyclophilin family peptidyl-prolyl cis-trans isomerase